MTTTPFTKMHALGNHFVLFDAIQSPIAITAERARRVAHPKLGIGCDQILLISQSSTQGDEIRYQIFNADGSEVGQCLNGTRCIADYLFSNKIITNDAVTLVTQTTRMVIHKELKQVYRTSLPEPIFHPDEIPIQIGQQQKTYRLHIAQQEITFSALSLGNPHAVIRCANVETAPVQELGAACNAHEFFPEGVNLGFMELCNRQQIRLRVYERGVGETDACGSGAVAAAVAGIRQGILDTPVEVCQKYGRVTVAWTDAEGLSIRGPATHVYRGSIDLNDTE